MIEIIKAEEKHVIAIGKLWWGFMIFHQNIDHIFTPREGSILSFEEHQLRRMMKSEESLVLVALDGANIVGFSLTEIRGLTPGFERDKFGHIDDMGVTASHRRKGIGEKMLVEIIKWLQLKNIKRVELGIAAKNQIADSFWHKHGFEIYSHTLYKEIK